jgi:hypothetical protein
MSDESKNCVSSNPLGMIPDPYDGKLFVLPATACTMERRQFLRRMNDILGFLYVTCLCYHEYRDHFEKVITTLPDKGASIIKIGLNSGNAIMRADRVLKFTREGVDVVARQIFIMFYGSFETYLFELFERSYGELGIVDNHLDRSRRILMKGMWDGKFCRMSNVFGCEYKASELIRRFTGFKMDFEGTQFGNPLDFLDALAQVRHRVVHASSILGEGKVIFIDVDILPVLAAFLNKLTDYIDYMFARRFRYERVDVKPAEA